MEDKKILANLLLFGREGTDIVRFECYQAAPKAWSGVREVTSKSSVFSEAGLFDADKASMFVQTFEQGNKSHRESETTARVLSAVVIRLDQGKELSLPDEVELYDPVEACLSFGRLYGDDSFCQFGGESYVSSKDGLTALADITLRRSLVLVGEESLEHAALLSCAGNKVLVPRGQVELARQATEAGAFTALVSSAFGLDPREVADFAPLICNLDLDLYQFSLSAGPIPVVPKRHIPRAVPKEVPDVQISLF